MKNILSILLLATMCFNAHANTQPPRKQKVFSIVKQYQPVSFYEEQLMLWREDLKQNPKSTEAWLNVYTATRMLRILQAGKSQADLDAVVEEVKKNIPETFEGYYIQYWNGNNEEEKFPMLMKAYEMNPERPETYDDFVTMYELQRDKIKLKEFCEKWFSSNDLSVGLLAFGYNMLMSCDENAILVTQGDNDTYPPLILQHAKNIRPDVAVLNLSLLYKKEYRDKYFKELGIPEYVSDSKITSFEGFCQSICDHMQRKSNRPFYYASTVEQSYYSNVKDKVYLVGLAFKYSAESFDNVAVLKRNYEKYFLKDYLKINLTNDISQTVVDHMNGSYLMPLLTLHNHYSEAEDKQGLEELDVLVKRIAEKSNQTEEVNKVLLGETNGVVTKVVKDPKELIKDMVKIREDFYASSTETTNKMYQLFLEDLLKQKRYNDLMVAKQEDVNWESLLLPQYKSLTPAKYFEHGLPDAENIPVNNISYEAAVLYCNWLTTVYNGLEARKKAFKKVKFRLPTEKEWEMLAYAGKGDQYKFPWGYLPDTKEGVKRDVITNPSGCYLANVQTEKEVKEAANVCPSHDGGIFMVPVTSYNPNDFGLYCMIGNVAEMVSEKGIAKGGGWNTQIDQVSIASQQKYAQQDPNIGFRVVMEIIEK